MDHSPAITYVKDERGRYVYTNRANASRFGMPISGKTDAELFSPELARQHQLQDAKVLEEGQAQEFTETSVEDDGEHTWHTIKFPVRDVEGRRFVGAMSFDVTDRKRIEDELRKTRDQQEGHIRERTQELNQANGSLRQLSARLLGLQDEERRRIARELHDSVGQMLVALGLNLGSIEGEAQGLNPELTRALVEHRALLQDAINEVRIVSYILHPPLLDETGLASAIRWYVEGFEERSDVAVQLDVPANFSRLSQEIETALFRIMQECLTNIVRHSHSKTAGVKVTQTEEQVVFTVRDAGRGIPREKLMRIKQLSGAGVGLRGIKERVRELGGILDIESDDTGTIVTVNLPVSAIEPPITPSQGCPEEKQA